METGQRRLAFIDAMRGLAILGVLAIHTSQAVPNLSPLLVSVTSFGLLGVQLFFMLSALTLLSIYRWDTFSALPFYLRRFFRIAPAFYLAGLIYTALWPKEVGITSFLVTLGFAQVWLPATVKNIVPGGWSISVEAAFYVAFPFFLAVLTTLPRALGAAILGFIAASAWAILAHRVLEGTYDKPIVDDFIYFGFVWNLPAFLLGAVLFHALPPAQRIADAFPRATRVAFYIVTALLVLAASGVDPLNRRASAVVLIAAFVLLVGITGTRVMVNRPMCALGKISFSVYLVHFAVLRVGIHFAGYLEGLPPSIQLVAQFVIVLILSSLISMATWQVIERPGISLGRHLTQFAGRRHAKVTP